MSTAEEKRHEFNNMLRSAVSVTIDKREGLTPTSWFDPYVEIKTADGQTFYISQDGNGRLAWGNGSAA